MSQEDLRDVFEAQPGTDRLARRRIHGTFNAAGIETRHMVLTGLCGDPDGTFVGEGGSLLSPATGVRNKLYRTAAPPLAEEAARNALAEADTTPESVTHLITVSCTGFFAPGIDYRLVRDLGLNSTVERIHLGFIGCAAALPALRTASQIAESRPGAVVLVVCVELCSLHVRRSTDPEQIVAASVFADGAAAAVVTTDDSVGSSGGLELERFATTLTSEGESDMFWTIGDHGFEMTLSSQVPRIIGREVRSAIDGIFTLDDLPSIWAVHPGGRSVLDRVKKGLDLLDTTLDDSRAVLRDYGNMSSATILFVLKRILEDPDRTGPVAAMAFGPGLTVESALMEKR